MKVANEWEDYKILDMADGQKLERWGQCNFREARPTNYLEREVFS